MEQRMEEDEERILAVATEKKKLQGTVQDLEEQFVHPIVTYIQR